MALDVNAVNTTLELVVPVAVVLKEVDYRTVEADDHDVDVTTGHKALGETKDVGLMGQAADVRHSFPPDTRA